MKSLNNFRDQMFFLHLILDIDGLLDFMQNCAQVIFAEIWGKPSFFVPLQWINKTVRLKELPV